MFNPISSNMLQYMATSQAMPSSSQAGNSPLGSMGSENSIFTMIMNAAMQSMQQAQTVPPEVPLGQNPFASQFAGAFTPIQVIIQPYLPQAAGAQPTVVPVSAGQTQPSLAFDTAEVPTTAGDTSDFGFKPVQFLKLENMLEGKLSGAANHFINAGKKYNIDPSLLTAIAIHETGNGSSRAANDKNNVAGMMGKDGLRSYASVEDSIFDMARNLRKNYLNQGKDSIAAIGAKYAPVGAANDPTGLNNHWTNGVSKQFSNLA
ncbi:flagellum-specific peptidoglycan hydrolase FlgJ [Planomicrobium koreense]|uniref:Flagellum-specific peptidoglycan hydrolase FlgJ n=1 Tax=Planococcus koreensis TaxID=112331 RepID=A0A7W8CPZ0_9BACL|nr:glucosaminidase domain-containing protein [Planococcus koreensis]MBB5179326.1 flagellum-specific peptidoglycan hydrolase FlgJ [Planococcus koreensis]